MWMIKFGSLYELCETCWLRQGMYRTRYHHRSIRHHRFCELPAVRFM